LGHNYNELLTIHHSEIMIGHRRIKAIIIALTQGEGNKLFKINFTRKMAMCLLLI
jgi:hypothetical protein